MNFFRSKLCILLLLLALGASLGACGYRPEPEKTESGQTVFRLGFSETPKTEVMHKLYTGCINCTKHADPFTCPEIAMKRAVSW